MSEHRLDPDKLLQRVQEEERQEKRGKLKIYLGAAPGVGKTHEMLHDALGEHKKGLDVVVGIAESHGRKEIDALLKKFEVLPRLGVEYHGKRLLEFDLDGAFKRHPGLILIDEMAHSNVPGLRHKKRWQDIKELLDRGVDVWTTLNVQHIESLTDDVSQIIHAPILETVPDSMIERADAIELVDIPPEELLKRLHEGKVYIPEQAKLAAAHFFRKGNLTALRELALRVTAERVNVQVLSYREGQGIRHVWPTKEKILVCVGPGSGSLKLIRAAKRMATSLQGDWLAVYIDAPRFKSSEENRNLAIQHLRYAELLGAEVRVLTGSDIVEVIMDYAREKNVTQIMVWKYIRKRWRDFFFRSLADEIVRSSGEINVYIMTGTAEAIPPKKISQTKRKIPWLSYFWCTVMVGILTLLNLYFFPYMSASNIVMLYLFGITMAALLGEMGPSIYTAIISIFAYDFLFISPYHSFVGMNAEHIVTLVGMFFISQVISQLSLVTRRQAKAAQLSAHQTSALYTLSRQLANTRGIDKLLHIGTDYIANEFDSEVIALLPGKNQLIIRARSRTDQVLDEKEQGVAEWVYELGQKAGLNTDSLSFSKALYLPLLGSQKVIGVLRIRPLHPETLALPEQSNLLDACANQIALAIEVDRLQEKTTRTEMKLETNRVRSELLRAVSHDLRSPLVAIVGAASSQIEMAKNLDAKAVENLGHEIYSEAEQLSRLINNLLQITYLEVETVKIQKEFLSIKDTIDFVLEASSKKLDKRPIRFSMPEHLPLVPFDNALIQSVLFNLIDNAIKFTPDKTPIEISVTEDQDKIIVSIRDHGPGIMTDEINKLFEKFYRGRMLGETRGLGLGLAICRNVIQVHGGEIWAENAKEGGAIFKFSLPLK